MSSPKLTIPDPPPASKVKKKARSRRKITLRNPWVYTKRKVKKKSPTAKPKLSASVESYPAANLVDEFTFTVRFDKVLSHDEKQAEFLSDLLLAAPDENSTADDPLGPDALDELDPLAPITDSSSGVNPTLPNGRPLPESRPSVFVIKRRNEHVTVPLDPQGDILVLNMIQSDMSEIFSRRSGEMETNHKIKWISEWRKLRYGPNYAYWTSPFVRKNTTLEYNGDADDDKDRPNASASSVPSEYYNRNQINLGWPYLQRTAQGHESSPGSGNDSASNANLASGGNGGTSPSKHETDERVPEKSPSGLQGLELDPRDCSTVKMNQKAQISLASNEATNDVLTESIIARKESNLPITLRKRGRPKKVNNKNADPDSSPVKINQKAEISLATNEATDDVLTESIILGKETSLPKTLQKRGRPKKVSNMAATRKGPESSGAIYTEEPLSEVCQDNLLTENTKPPVTSPKNDTKKSSKSTKPKKELISKTSPPKKTERKSSTPKRKRAPTKTAAATADRSLAESSSPVVTSVSLDASVPDVPLDLETISISSNESVSHVCALPEPVSAAPEQCSVKEPCVIDWSVTSGMPAVVRNLKCMVQGACRDPKCSTGQAGFDASSLLTATTEMAGETPGAGKNLVRNPKYRHPPSADTRRLRVNNIVERLAKPISISQDQEANQLSIVAILNDQPCAKTAQSIRTIRNGQPTGHSGLPNVASQFVRQQQLATSTSGQKIAGHPRPVNSTGLPSQVGQPKQQVMVARLVNRSVVPNLNHQIRVGGVRGQLAVGRPSQPAAMGHLVNVQRSAPNPTVQIKACQPLVKNPEPIELSSDSE